MIADVDLDRLPDVIGVRDGRLIVAFGDGQGGFSQIRERPVGVAEGPAAIADLDGDDRPDAVLAGRGGLTVLRGTEERRFETIPWSRPLPGEAPPTVAALRGRTPELVYVVTSVDGNAEILDPDKGRSFPLSHPVRLARAADLDGDGRDELAAIGGGVLRVLEPNGEGWALAASRAGLEDSRLIAGGDRVYVLDEHGRPLVLDGALRTLDDDPFMTLGDLVAVLDAGGERIAVTSSGIVGPSGPLVAPSGEWALAAAGDMNGDGRIDVIRAGPSGLEVVVASCGGRPSRSRPCVSWAWPWGTSTATESPTSCSRTRTASSSSWRGASPSG